MEQYWFFKLPIYEPGLAKLLKDVEVETLFFESNWRKDRAADMVFISVNTPTKKKGIGAGKQVI